MASFLGNMAKENMNLSDEVIGKSMINSAIGSANAYLNAIMTSTTPEIKAMFGANLNQIIDGHTALTELAIKNEWGNPYIDPKEQLSTVYQKVNLMQEEQQER